jgi:hypothetical protein
MLAVARNGVKTLFDFLLSGRTWHGYDLLATGRLMDKRRNQLNLSPPDEFMVRIRRLAKKFYNSEEKKNRVAMEVLDAYLEVWEQDKLEHLERIKQRKTRTSPIEYSSHAIQNTVDAGKRSKTRKVG